MLVIVGLVVLLVAVIVGFTGVLANAGPAHPLTENFSVLGYHVTGSTGTLFLFGIVVGAVAMLGLSVLLAGARRTAGRGRDTRHQLARSQRETAFLNQERDQRLEHQQADTASGTGVNPQPAPTPRHQGSPAGSLLARSTTDRQSPDAGRPRTRLMRSARSRGPVNTENEGIRNEHW
jgi:hypothetical protein